MMQGPVTVTFEKKPNLKYWYSSWCQPVRTGLKVPIQFRTLTANLLLAERATAPSLV